METLMHVTLGVEYELQRNALGFMSGLYLDYGVTDKFLQNIADIQAAWHETLGGMGINPETMRKATSLVPMVIDAVEELLPEPEPDNVSKIAADMKSCFC
jgi:translation elongation factor EF-G